MKIFVCVKHVPDSAARISLTGDTSYDDETAIKFVVNPYDEYAIEEAVSLVSKHGGEVVILSVGKEPASASIRAALAMGADRGIHITTDQQFLDSSVIALAIKKAIEKDGTPDLVFTGKQSIDSEGLQTQYRLAEEMNLPVVNGIVDLKIDEEKVIVEREIDEGAKEVLQLRVPCIIGATKGLNTPRYPKLPDIMKAKKKAIETIDISELSIDMLHSELELVKLGDAPSRSRARMLSGTAQEMAAEFINIMQEDEKVL